MKTMDNRTKLSSARRGGYWKARSKRWLERRGFPVADMEIVRTIFTRGRLIGIKRDQWGADLMYATPLVFVLVQVKGGAKPTSTLTKQALREFEKHRFPRHSRRELHVWRPRAHVPEVVRCQ